MQPSAMLIDDEYAGTIHRNPDRRQNGDMKIEVIEEPTQLRTDQERSSPSRLNFGLSNRSVVVVPGIQETRNRVSAKP